MWLQIRMYLLIGVLFGLLFALILAVGTALGGTSIIVYVVLAVVMVLLQFLLSPFLVGLMMKVKYVSEKEEPELHQMVTELAREAGIPKPKVGISQISVPNAFAFGRTRHDARICVTEGIRKLLTKDEMRAVLGHEISHIKHRDMAVITLLSLVPSVCYYIAISLMWGGMLGGRRRNTGSLILIGVGAFVLYFITNLLVLYGSRIREYYADEGSVKLGNKPHFLASALYRLSYANARTPKEEKRSSEGLKAFFISDPSQAKNEITELKQIDRDMSGTIDADELAAVRNSKMHVGTADKMMEILSTHPNMLKRIQRLATLQNN
jgi:heat shock protein HtpX